MQNEKKEETGSEKQSWVQAEKLVQIGVMLPLALIVGYFLGSWLDDKFHTTWIRIAGLLLGIAAGFVQLVRTATSDEAKK